MAVADDHEILIATRDLAVAKMMARLSVASYARLTALEEATRAMYVTALRAAAARDAKTPRAQVTGQGWRELFEVAAQGAEWESNRLSELWASEPDDTSKLAELRAAATMYRSALVPVNW